MQAMTEWERRTAPILAFFSLFFVLVWAWPIVDPDIPQGWLIFCRATNVLLWIVFVVDLIIRWRQAPPGSHWKAHHVFDVVTVFVPLARPMRFLRYVMQVGIIRRSALHDAGGQVMVYTVVSTILAIIVGSVSVLGYERGAAGSSIETFGESLWWTCVTMATVGYGDYVTVTMQGRLIAVGLMFGGVLITGAVAGAITSWVSDALRARRNKSLGDRIELEVGDVERAVSAGSSAQVAEVARLRDEMVALRSAIEELNRSRRNTSE
jgi:voltage-gated potassium channel